MNDCGGHSHQPYGPEENKREEREREREREREILVPINRVCIIGNCTLSLNHA